MKTKKIYLPFLLFLSCLFFNSCSKDEFTESNELISYEDRIENLEKLSNLVFDLNARAISKSTDLNEEDALALLTPVIEQSKGIFQYLGITPRDLNLNDEEENLVFAAFGMAMAIEFKTKDIEVTSTGMYAKSGFVDCLKDVVGLTAVTTLVEAGLELYAGEVAAGYAVDAVAAAAFRKAALKAAGTIIKRFAGPVGAVVMIAEFAYCMSQTPYEYVDDQLNPLDPGDEPITEINE